MVMVTILQARKPHLLKVFAEFTHTLDAGAESLMVSASF